MARRWQRSVQPPSEVPMSAIDLLESQHREVAKLFKQIEKTSSGEEKIRLFEEIADKLAIHAAIEEHHFYPAVKAKRTEDILLEAVEEHLVIKRTLADLLQLEVGDEHFDAKITVLKEEVEHHVGEEEKDLFPKVKKILSKQELDALEQEMVAEQEELEEEGNPREGIPDETGEAAPV
jgi:hemerythrin superfamily protein